MTKKLYNTYSVGEEVTLFEIDRLNIRGIEYLLLLQKQKPNILCVGFLEEQKLELVNNPVISREILKIFLKDENSCKEKLEPFIIKDKKS